MQLARCIKYALKCENIFNSAWGTYKKIQNFGFHFVWRSNHFEDVLLPIIKGKNLISNQKITKRRHLGLEKNLFLSSTADGQPLLFTFNKFLEHLSIAPQTLSNALVPWSLRNFFSICSVIFMWCALWLSTVTAILRPWQNDYTRAFVGLAL